MNFKFRYACTFLLALAVTAVIYGLLDTLLEPDVPTKVMTKFIYEPGYDIVNPTLCQRSEGLRSKVLIGVMSAPRKQRERMAIRNTWGNISSEQEVVVVFFIGRSLDPEENQLINQESLEFLDIVRGNNIDSYRNLTLKTISFLDWSQRYCAEVRFIFKVDDDVFVNIDNLISFVDDSWRTKTIYGELGSGLGPMGWTSKWYVSSLEYDKPVYPDFVFGGAYLISSDSVGLLYTQSLSTIFFKLEDVFITGIVAESIGISRVHSRFFVRIYYTRPKIGDFKKEVSLKISVHGLDYQQQVEAWNAITKQY